MKEQNTWILSNVTMSMYLYLLLRDKESGGHDSKKFKESINMKEYRTWTFHNVLFEESGDLMNSEKL